MAEQSEQIDSAVSKPTYTKDETAQAIATLLDKETARNDEPETEVSEDKKDDLEIDTNDPVLEDINVDEVVDNEEAKLESQEELYDVTVNGNKVKVTLDELLKGYSRESDYTQKTQELGNQRRDVESMQENLKSELDAVKSSRNKYSEQLGKLVQQLQTEDNIDWQKLYETDPAEYVKKKAESDARKEQLETAKVEQNKILFEQKKEQEKIYNNYLANERKLLTEKLPVYGDPNKSEEFTKRLTSFAKDKGYTDQEISMMVDHRAIVLLADAYRYNQLKQTKLNKNKVKNAPKMVKSNAANVDSDSADQEKMNTRMKKLKQSGHINDAKDVFKEMFFNK
jgi:hypothetical protein